MKGAASNVASNFGNDVCIPGTPGNAYPFCANRVVNESNHGVRAYCGRSFLPLGRRNRPHSRHD